MKTLFAALAAFSLLFLACSQATVGQPAQTIQTVTVPAGQPQVVYVQQPAAQVVQQPQVVYVQQQQPATYYTTTQQPQTIVYSQPPVQYVQQPAQQVVQGQPPVQYVQVPAQTQPQVETVQQVQVQAQAQPQAQTAQPQAQPQAQVQAQAQAQPQVDEAAHTGTASYAAEGSGFDQVYRVAKSGVDHYMAAAEEAAKNEQPSTVIDVVKNFLDSSLMDIVWCGEKKNTIFMLSETNTLYRSVDDGATGHMMTNHLETLGKKELGNTEKHPGKPIRMIQHPTDKNILLVLGSHGVNWITENCGSNFRVMNKDKYFEEIKFHPTERNWALGTSWNSCGEHVINEACHVSRQLFITQDLGNTWTKVIDFVYDFAWGKADETFFFIPNQRIIVSHFAQATENQQISSWDPRLQVSFSDDLFQTYTDILMGGNRFTLTSNYLFIIQAVNGSTEEVRLHVTDPRRTYKTREIEIPTGRLTSKDFTLLDTSEHSVFLHVDHSSSTHGGLYVSDSTGVRFSLVLKNNARDYSGRCDFERVQGLEGIYLANAYDTEAIKHFQKLESEGQNEIPFQHGGTKKTSADAYQRNSADNRMRNTAEKKLEDYKKTFISFDKGGIWQGLIPPERDASGKKIVCVSEEECNLHLHSLSSQRFGPFYTTTNSLGIILGTGNVGAYLSNKPDEVNTYLSRDGGLNWFEIANGSHIYDVGDHGGLIIMAPDQTGTKTVQYSWDEGISWRELVISDVDIEVTNIITEPSNIGEKFVVYGREKGGKRGVVVAIDFTPLHQRICGGHDKPDTPESDYETFTPNGRISPHCLLGRQITYVRRKREAQCFNNEERDDFFSMHSCECTEEDWECDYGYSRQGTGPCMPMDDKIRVNATAIPEVCDSYYFISQGYRKVGGDSCRAGIDHSPLKLTCPGQGVTSSKNLLMLLILASVVAGFMYLNKRVSPDAVKALIFTVREKIMQFRNKGSNPRKDGYSSNIPASADDDDEEMFSNTVFDNDEEAEEQGEAISLVERNPKKMTEGKAMDTAQKSVPKLNKPGEKKEI